MKTWSKNNRDSNCVVGRWATPIKSYSHQRHEPLWNLSGDHHVQEKMTKSKMGNKKGAPETTFQPRWSGMVFAGENGHCGKLILRTRRLTHLWDWDVTTILFIYCLHLFTISCSPVSRSVTPWCTHRLGFLAQTTASPQSFWCNRNLSDEISGKRGIPQLFWICLNSLFGCPLYGEIPSFPNESQSQVSRNWLSNC